MNFFVAGLPKGQPRAKACRFGKVSRVYDPGTADEWKLLVRDAANKQWDKEVMDGAIRLCVDLYFPRPKSHFTKKGRRPDAPEFHTSKPDSDNAAKAIMDALTNLGVWRDDSLVASLSVVKRYADGQAGATISIEHL